MHLTTLQWVCLGLGAFFTGLSKTGMPGVGILAVVLFANALPARESTGALLPLLLCGDVFGVSFYRRHASWPHLWKLLPWVALGVIGGFFAVKAVSNAQMQRLLGGVVLGMVALHLWRRRPAGTDSPMPHRPWFGAGMGILAGLTTMVANAAGPVMILYFLAIGLPKLVFVGTGAWFFMLVNALKVPFSVRLGLITSQSLLLDGLLLVPMLPGALLGPWLLPHIDQKHFEQLMILLTAAAALKLMVW